MRKRPFECWVLNKGTTGTIFITPLLWRGPSLGIESGTSRTRSQHYTTRLSRRWYGSMMIRISKSLIAKMNIYVLCWITLLQLLSNVFLSYQTQARYTYYLCWFSNITPVWFFSFTAQSSGLFSSYNQKGFSWRCLKSCQDEFNDILLLICCVDFYSLSQ